MSNSKKIGSILEGLRSVDDGDVSEAGGFVKDTVDLISYSYGPGEGKAVKAAVKEAEKLKIKVPMSVSATKYANYVEAEIRIDTKAIRELTDEEHDYLKKEGFTRPFINKNLLVKFFKYKRKETKGDGVMYD